MKYYVAYSENGKSFKDNYIHTIILEYPKEIKSELDIEKLREEISKNIYLAPCHHMGEIISWQRLSDD